MNMIRSFLLPWITAAALVTPANAATLNVEGTVQTSCSITAGQDGIQGISVDGDLLSTRESGGRPATLNYSTVGDFKLRIAGNSGIETGLNGATVKDLLNHYVAYDSQAYPSNPTKEGKTARFADYNLTSSSGVVDVHLKQMSTSSQPLQPGTYESRLVVSCEAI